MLTDVTLSNIAFKNLLNKSHTDNGKVLGGEAESIKFNVHADTVFADVISATGSVAVAAGIAVKVDATLLYDSSSNGHAFFARWPVTPPSGTDPDTSFPYTYGAGSLASISAGDRVRNAISFAFGNDYEAIPYHTSVAPSNRIFVFDVRDWVYQYQSGVFFQEDAFAAPTPAFITLYAYTGKYVTDAIGGGSSIVNVVATNTSPDNNFVGTGTPPILGYQQEIIYLTVFDFTNTGPVTLDIDGYGPTPVYKRGDAGLTDLDPGDVGPSVVYMIVYDGTRFELFTTAEVSEGVMNFIPAGTTIKVDANFQYLVYGDLTVTGNLVNDGQVVIINGGIVLQGAGAFTNNGSLQLVSLQLGNEGKYVADFSTTANVPLTVNHGLGSLDFVYTVKEGTQVIDVQLEIVNTNNITITTTSNVSGRIVIISA